MNETVHTIPLSDLFLAFVPLFIIISIFYIWNLDWKNKVYGFSRMLLQLFLVGSILKYIFKTNNLYFTVILLLSMLFLASWISLRINPSERNSLLVYPFFSILLGAGFSLIIVIKFILKIEPWFLPKYVIPIAGMLLSSSMNGISLAYDRISSELSKSNAYDSAKKIALEASLIPNTNTLFAVGIVSLPGMMTGQILSGVEPILAVRYQVMIISTLFASAGISSAFFLYIIENKLRKKF